LTVKTTQPEITVPPLVEEYYYKGLTSYAAGVFESAVDNFNQAIKLDPTYAPAYLYRGMVYQQQGLFENARADYLKVLTLPADSETQAQAKTQLEQLGKEGTITPSPPTSTPTMSVPLPTPPKPVGARLDQAFTLSLNQEARFEEDDLLLRFTSVLEDSRCPKQVLCAWSGQGIVQIQVQQNGSLPTSFELNTIPSLKQDTVDYMKYTIHLLDLAPYPEDPQTPIPPGAYTITLVVTRR
jgi:tetratricopeptide (TPR) repeat protein